MQQHEVDAWFEAHVRVWSDVYGGSGLSDIIYQQRRDRALGWVDHLGLSTGTIVLDLGCGAGFLAVALARRGMRVHAIDSVWAMLATTREHAGLAGRSVHVLQSDTHQLGLADNGLDLVVALGLVPWLHSPHEALREIARVLRPGGYLLVSADNRARLTYLADPRYSAFLEPLRNTGRRLVRRPRQPGINPWLHWPREFDQLLEATGFEKVRSATIGFGPFTLFKHRLLPEAWGVRLHHSLQELADRRTPGLRLAGSHYLVLARARHQA